MYNDDHTSGWETVSQAAVESLSTERGEKGFHKNAIFPKGKYTTRGFLNLEVGGKHIYLPLSRTYLIFVTGWCKFFSDLT